MVINLLPWREHKAAYEQNLFKLRLGISLGVITFILIGWHYLIALQIKNVSARIDELEIKLSQRLASLSKNKIQTNKKVVSDPLMQNVFNALEKTVTSEVCYTDIVQTHQGVLFKGRANSSIALTDYLKQWRPASFFTEINIQALNQSQESYIEFQFQGLANQVGI